MLVVKLKLPALSNWFVRSGIQGDARLVVPSRTKFALPTPPVPLKPSVLPEMERLPMTGVVFSATEIIPAEFKLFVFQAKPNGSDGSCTLENAPAMFVASKSLNVSPAANCDSPALVTISAPLNPTRP